MFTQVVSDSVEDALNGYNATIFAVRRDRIKSQQIINSSYLPFCSPYCCSLRVRRSMDKRGAERRLR